jgi:hypothetical protein
MSDLLQPATRLSRIGAFINVTPSTRTVGTSSTSRSKRPSEALVEFLPMVFVNCWIGYVAIRCRTSFQPLRFWVVQSP